MIEFSNLIRFCADRYKKISFCQHCNMKNCLRGETNNCYCCLHELHQYNCKEHYCCEKITYNYVLKHFHRYTSECIKALLFIKKYFDKNLPLNIVSIGCGPSSELYAAAYAYPEFQIKYFGYDMNSTWQPIQNFNITNLSNIIINYSNANFWDCYNEQTYFADILIMNYLLSDLVKSEGADDFVTRITQAINSGHFSFIIINDVALFYNSGTGYSLMERICRGINDNNNFRFEYIRRHFSIPNEYQITYGKKEDDTLIIQTTEEESMPYDPFEKCGSIQLIIHCKRVN